MKNLIIVNLFTLTALVALAKPDKHSHRSHGAHQHGSAQLGIAFEGSKGQVDLKTPSDSIIGFEYSPKSEKDKKQKSDNLQLLELKIGEMLAFENSLKCKFTKKTIETKSSQKNKNTKAEHSDLFAVFEVQCEKSPIGSSITFNFRKYFPNLKDIDVQLIADDIQKSLEVNKDLTTLSVTK